MVPVSNQDTAWADMKKPIIWAFMVVGNWKKTSLGLTFAHTVSRVIFYINRVLFIYIQIQLFVKKKKKKLR